MSECKSCESLCSSLSNGFGAAFLLIMLYGAYTAACDEWDSYWWHREQAAFIGPHTPNCFVVLHQMKAHSASNCLYMGSDLIGEAHAVNIEADGSSYLIEKSNFIEPTKQNERKPLIADGIRYYIAFRDALGVGISTDPSEKCYVAEKFSNGGRRFRCESDNHEYMEEAARLLRSDVYIGAEANMVVFTNEPKHFTWTISPKTIHSQDTTATKGDEKR